MRTHNDDREVGEQVRADLAFMKALVEKASQSQMSGGAVFLAGGLLYGFQCLVQWAQLVELIHPSDIFMLLFVIAITVAFVVVAVAISVSSRAGERAVATRALNAAFGGAGLANMVLCSVFGFVAFRMKSMTIWLLYPITISVLQGFMWYIAYMMKKRLWIATLCAGWYLTAIALGVLMSSDDLPSYILVLSLALFLLMALPGWYMMRLAGGSD
jgi:hypothetical protein